MENRFSPELLEREAGDKLEIRQIAAERIETVKLANVVPPIRFDSGVADISPAFVDSLRKTLDDLSDRLHPRRLLDELLNVLLPPDDSGGVPGSRTARSRIIR